MSEIRISGFDNNHKEHILLVQVQNGLVSIKYDAESYPSFKLEDFIDKADSYKNDNFGKGIPYFERDFLKQFKLANKNGFDCTLLRCLAITLPLFKYAILKNLPFNKEFSQYMFGLLHFEWSGDMGEQPFIYMISRKLIQRYGNSVKSLYQAGILYKYVVSQTEAYFVPFDFSDYPPLSTNDEKELWDLIKKEINQSILHIAKTVKE